MQRRNRPPQSRPSFRQRCHQFIRFSKFLLPYWDKQILLLICIIFSTPFSLASPYIAKLTIDYAFARHDLYLFNFLILIGIVVFIWSTTVGAVQTYISAYISQMLDYDLRSRIYRHLNRLSLAFFQTRSTGEQIYRMNTDISGVVSLATGILPQLISMLFRFCFLLCITLWMDPRLTCAVILGTPLFYLHTRYFGKKQQKVRLELRNKSEDITTELQEAISHAKLIKATGKEMHFVRRYLHLWIQRIRVNFKNLKITSLSDASGATLTTLGTTALSYYIGYGVIKGTISLGSMVAIIAYLTQLFGVMRGFSGLYMQLLVAFISVDKVLETLDAGIDITEPGAPGETGKIQRIDFHHVSFGYKEGIPILDNVSFSLQAGKTYAFVGPSGVGKTTIINLLLRLYDPWKGSICINNIPLTNIRLSEYRGRTGIALQEPYLFNVSIKDNIAFCGNDAGMDAIRMAAKAADADAFIRNLPEGYDTVVGEGGCTLSEGQKQRISIARALLNRPDLMILDEATSFLSSDSEKDIHDMLRRDGRPGITLIVSHRLSAIKGADRIFVLDQGRVVESGSHRELISLDKQYGKLFLEQTRIKGKSLPADENIYPFPSKRLGGQKP